MQMLRNLSFIFIAFVLPFHPTGCSDGEFGGSGSSDKDTQNRPSEETGGVPGFALGCSSELDGSTTTKKLYHCSIYKDDVLATDEFTARTWGYKESSEYTVMATDETVNGIPVGAYTFEGSATALDDIDTQGAITFGGNDAAGKAVTVESKVGEAKVYQEKVINQTPLP